jgi:outer membrane immunogenic protein
MMQRFSLTLLAAAVVALTGSQTASAADLGRPPPPVYVPPAAPPFSWTGWYVGGNLGVAWTQGSVSDSFGNSFSNAQKAVFIGGGQVGANYQINWLVIGGEADFDWLANDHNSSNTVFVPGVGALQVSTNDRWITTVAARRRCG